jgi:hypothetical protein
VHSSHCQTVAGSQAQPKGNFCHRTGSPGDQDTSQSHRSLDWNSAGLGAQECTRPLRASASSEIKERAEAQSQIEKELIRPSSAESDHRWVFINDIALCFKSLTQTDRLSFDDNGLCIPKHTDGTMQVQPEALLGEFLREAAVFQSLSSIVWTRGVVDSWVRGSVLICAA